MLVALFYGQSQQTFQNAAPQLGITGMSGLGHSVGWGDIDNDGAIDLFAAGHFEEWVLFKRNTMFKHSNTSQLMKMKLQGFIKTKNIRKCRLF